MSGHRTHLRRKAGPVVILLSLVAVAAPGPCGEKQKASPGPAALARGEPLVAFIREGGFAGFDDRLEIGGDGRAALLCVPSRWEAMTLSPEETSRLQRALDDSGLFAADRSLISVGADLVTYTLRYGGHTLASTEDKVPSRLGPVLDQLLDVLARLKPRCQEE
jgi:hypothetical protein